MSFPHFPQSTKLTSRAALSQEDGLANNLLSQHEQDSDPEVQRLHEFVRCSLGSFEVYQMRTKRRKLDNPPMEVDTEPTNIPFRLISWTLPARPIHLMPVHHPSVRYQRPAEDTVYEAQLRQLRAQEAAVDADRILAYTGWPNSKATPPAAHTLTPMVPDTNPSQLPNLLVTERRRSAILSAPKADENTKQHGQIKCCPLVSLADQALSDKPKRKRKKRPAVRGRPPPAFFRPMQQWGGKSAGYAMGWRGSWPVDRPEPRHYARDRMYKGTLGNLV